jgi:hypothetical protein
VERIDARQLLSGLVGRTIPTLTGRPNTVLRIDCDAVVVATNKSPSGKPVQIEWVQNALDRLTEEGEIEISVASVGYRSAFIGAALATIPGAVTSVHPRMIRLGRAK